MSYWQLYYHIVWATKNRAPLVTAAIEASVYDLIMTKARTLGATVYAVNGMENHTHFVGSIPPSIALANFIGQIKGVTSAQINKQHIGHPLYWQDDYSIFSFDGKRLPNYIAYVQRQKEHHHAVTTIPILERTEGKNVVISEPAELYSFEDDHWRDELLGLELANHSLDNLSGRKL